MRSSPTFPYRPYNRHHRQGRRMFHVVLWQPEIPPNTGNIARLCAGTGAALHLVGPLGFSIDDKAVKRAGLDYWKFVDLRRHDDWPALLQVLGQAPLWFVDNPAPQTYTAAAFADGDALVFGSETRGLPAGLRDAHADRLIGIPMPTGKVRSLNLSNAVAVVLYEALRQTGVA